MAESTDGYTKEEIFKAFRTVAINSMIMCVAAFGLINFLYNTSWYLTAYHYISRPILKYNYVDFLREKGELVSATDKTFVLPPTSSNRDDEYNNLSISLIDGAVGSNEERKIIAYDGATHTAIVEKRFDKIPPKGAAYQINNTGWYPRAVKNIYMAGPLLCAGLALIFFGLFYSASRKSINYRMFMLWAFIWSVNYLLAEWMAVSFLRYSGIGVLTRYWYWTERDRFIAALVALVIITFYGRFITNFFIQFTPSMKYMKRGNYRVLALYSILFPSIVTALAIVAFRMSYDWPITFALALGSMIMAVVTYSRAGERNFKVTFFEETYSPGISVGGLIFLGIIIALHLYLAVFHYSMEAGYF